MKQFARSYWKTLLFFVLIGILGGFFTGLYLMDTYPAEVQQQIMAQGINDVLLGVITAAQSAGYGLVLGVLGILLARKIGLWKDECSITKKPLAAAIAVSVIGGGAMILLDLLFFCRFFEALLASYAVKPSLVYILGAILYGGVIEEVMLRLFLLSLVAFVLHKLFGKKRAEVPTWIFVAANLIAALLFAAGHLPTTFTLFGSSPLIIFRCFLLNGGLGLTFGWLYRKYGLRYAMIAHAGCHIVSKLIWILFV